ncbi:hypothetical protein MY04_4098 [Flammeovirga sp. MY04]|uniref:Agarase B8 n=2 Tax=Flammeovirga yaeyamensis TaxID=367791 RepID=D0PR04_9BACT|nr:hypothetical protein [Flammeovirga sp. MY04]ACY02047.1 agarase B8 [Flammeovirga yaeyamensis]ANQ51442.1 hypothetical protein MY04_4098 [Flammeovirga sp. MY04]
MNLNLKHCVSSAILGLALFSTTTFAQNKVTVDPNTQRFLGNKTTRLDRDKYLQAHVWFGEKKDAEFEAFKKKYNINPEYQGSRRFWSPMNMIKNGKIPKVKNKYSGVREVKPYTVVTGRATDLFYDRKVDYSVEDITDYTKKVAAYIAQSYKKDWEEMPAIYEPYNEPMVHASDLYPGKRNGEKSEIAIKKISESLSEIGKAIHAVPELKNMKVAGYASAWPEFEHNNFDVWNQRFKQFIDIAGADMDILSVHLYDGKGLNNSGGRRSGSNAEAILDMIEAYSYIKLGEVKPIAITEYGRLVDDQPNWKPNNGSSNYHPIENAQAVRSQIHLAMQFMERGDNIVTTTPFSTGKQDPTKKYAKAGLWTKNDKGEWELTSRKYFFELWKSVKGKRVNIASENVDIQTQAFVNGKQLYVILNNLNEETQSIPLSVVGDQDFKNVLVKRIKTYVNKMPKMVNKTLKTAPESIDIEYGETILLTYNFNNKIETPQKEYRAKYYASEYLKPIQPNKKNTFEFASVTAGTKGSTTLRLGVGRAKGKSLQPTVFVNGQKVNLPNDIIRGYDQHNRKKFFGVLEIPVPHSMIKNGKNEVSVTFTDGGGHISSMILQVISDKKSFKTKVN